MNLQPLLIPVDNKQGETIYIDIDDLPPTDQLAVPKDMENSLWFKDFVQSILEHGQFEPIAVNKKGKKLTVTDGRKRLVAFRVLRDKFTDGPWEKIWAVVREQDETNAKIVSVVANHQRYENIVSDLETIQYMLDKYPGISEKDLAKNLKMNPQVLKQRMKMLKLDPELKGALKSGRMSQSVAKEAASLPQELQKTLAKKTTTTKQGETVLKPKITLDDIKDTQRVRVDNTVQQHAAVLFAPLPPTSKIPTKTKEQIYREALEEIASIIFNYDATPEAARKAVEIAEKALA